MTSPDKKIPEDGYTVSTLSALQALNEDSIRAQLKSPAVTALEEMKSSLGGNLLDGIANAIQQGLAGINIGGWFSSLNDVGVNIQDGQNSLSTRIDLIPRGYCSAYMTENINLEWGLNNNRRAPFKAQLGPAHGAHVDTTNGGIIFDLPGTWTISALMNARGTGYTGDDTVAMFVSVRKPDGSIYSEKKITAVAGTNNAGVSITQPVVIPEAGYYVAVWVWSGRWRWWNGGTNNSGLTVLRSALETDNPGVATVSDEAQPA